MKLTLTRSESVELTTIITHLRLFTSHFKNRVGLSLTKSGVLRVKLNIDGVPITSKSHTQPSHSQTSRLLTSSLSLGVHVSSPTNPEYVRHVDSSGLVFSLSSHRHSERGFTLYYRFIIHKNTVEF